MLLLSRLAVAAGLDAKAALALRHQAAVAAVADPTQFATLQPPCLAQLKR
jgi:hypothetical protein